MELELAPSGAIEPASGPTMTVTVADVLTVPETVTTTLTVTVAG